MISINRGLAGGLIVAVGLSLAPHDASAAWWPWGKRGEKAAAATVEPVPEATAPGGDIVTAQMDPVERLARSEQTIRELTGQIEELTFQLRQTQEQLQRLQADSDFRFQQLEGGAAKGTAPVAAKTEASEGSVLVIAKPPADAVAPCRASRKPRRRARRRRRSGA